MKIPTIMLAHIWMVAISRSCIAIICDSKVFAQIPLLCLDLVRHLVLVGYTKCTSPTAGADKFSSSYNTLFVDLTLYSMVTNRDIFPAISECKITALCYSVQIHDLCTHKNKPADTY